MEQEAPPVINFGGEGEVPGALNVNTLLFLIRPVESIRKSGPILEADMRNVPLPDEYTGEVIGNKLPMEASEEWAGQVCREAYRLLKWGGKVKFNSITGGGQGWVTWLENAGFVNVQISGRYAVGDKRQQDGNENENATIT